MSFINVKENRVNLQVFEYRQPGQETPSDPAFEFMTGNEAEKLACLGFTHEVIGPDPKDGGPMLICACPNADSARTIKDALDFLDRL
ncbi:hypothetical protein [Methanoregula sp.]|jgi:hypothetical protein|uniref:hypothetical protein n=1 Tax=Methanoregula sp. TaxID=2052170 RepID=UPI003567356E